MSDLADLRVSITADDKTDKGAKQAEKRLGQLPKRLGNVSRRAMNDNERLIGRSTKSIIGSFAKIEQASAKALGGRSLTSGLAGRMGAVGEAASAMGEGLAGAATSGGLLSAAVGGVAVAVGATVAVLGAAAVAAYKLATDWAKGAAQIGRTADIIGMGTKALQEFAAASERAGVDKSTAIGAAGSLSQTLNDARYGRNTVALEAMRRTGIEMKLNKDGTVNTDAMLPRIADAISRQNSSGRRTLARALGIPDAALPAFMQGGKALSADMRDTAKTANVLSGGELATARRIARKSVMLGQMGSRVLNKDIIGKLAAGGEGALDAALGGARSLVGAGEELTKSAGALERAANALQQAADRGGGPVSDQGSLAGKTAGMLGGLWRNMTGNSMQRAAQARNYFMRQGWNKDIASGLAAQMLAENDSFDPHRFGDHGQAIGILQWHRARQDQFRKLYGHDMGHATFEEEMGFINWELSNSYRGVGNRLRRGVRNAREAGAILSRDYVSPRDVTYNMGKRAELAAQIEAIPIKVEVQVNQHGHVTSAKATSGRGGRAAVSHAMPAHH